MARIRGTNAKDTLSGTGYNDSINGNGGDDVINAGGGNDFIYGGDGADLINGGNGIDTAAYDDSNTGVVVGLGEGSSFGYGYYGTAQGDRLFQVENIIGSNYADRLHGNSGKNVLTGGGGDDTLSGNGGDDILWGDSGDDFLFGGSGADILNGGWGNDTAHYTYSSAGVFISLYNDVAAGGEAEGDELNGIENVIGSAHHDDIWGDDGANNLSGRDGNDTLKGFGGDDFLAGGLGDDSLYGMDGADELFGSWGNDMLSGGAGDDLLIGHQGDDAMIGGIDNDSYYVDSLGDTVTELSGEGHDTVYSFIDMTLADNAEVLSLVIGNAVFGTGNALGNLIVGNDYDNVLDGGGGADDLWGLGGNDTFVLRAGQAHGDRIHEFYGNGAGVGDVLRFEGFGTLAEGATFHQISANQWQITSANGLIQETIILATGAVIDTTTDIIFV